MFGRSCPAPPVRFVHDSDLHDATLVGERERVRDLLASYVADCKILEQAEADAAEPRVVEEAERQLATTRRQWSAALMCLSALPAHTEGGVFAKIDALQSYRAEIGENSLEDPGAIALLDSILMDVGRLFGSRRGSPPNA